MSSIATGRDARSVRNDDHRTPRAFFERLNVEFAFALDAACSSGNALLTNCLAEDRGRNGLRESWSKASNGAAVFVNPPYSQLPEWIATAAHEGRRCVVVAIVPADTSTRWWRVVRHEASEIRFVEGRLRFRSPESGEYKSRQPSAVVVFRPSGGPPRYSYIRATIEEQPMPLFGRVR